MAGGVQTGLREGGGVAGQGDGGGGQGETEMELEMGGQQRQRAGEMRGQGQETEVQKRRKAAMRGVKTERRKKRKQGRKLWTEMQNAARLPVSHAKRSAPSAPTTPAGNALAPRYHDPSQSRCKCWSQRRGIIALFVLIAFPKP